MNRIPIRIDPGRFPLPFRPILENSAVYDSSCSRDARVFFLDRKDPMYLKSAPKGTLAQEAKMAAFFHQKGLSAPVLSYESLDRDWLLTGAVPGEDCTAPIYTQDPKRLSETLALVLCQLHETDFSGCPETDRTAAFIATAARNHGNGRFGELLLPRRWQFSSPEEAWRTAWENRSHLKNDTLIHGDYCLPNVLLRDWRFSGLIDVGNGGIGDKHMDLFWGAWSLLYNIKEEKYMDRFLDAYGREAMEPEMLRLVAAFELFG